MSNIYSSYLNLCTEWCTQKPEINDTLKKAHLVSGTQPDSQVCQRSWEQQGQGSLRQTSSKFQFLS